MNAGPGHAETNPFPGLRPFRSDENHLFFGREDQAAALLQLLRENRFLAVVGTSGSGKSSLVRAGLIPELHGGTMTRAGSAWEVVVLRPGGSPFENLARALIEADLYDAGDPNSLPRLRATLSRSRFGLVEAVKQSDVVEPSTNVLVVVDQFEELFRFRQQGLESEEAAAAFVNLLLTAVSQDECPVYVTITMRSDYLGDCSEIPGLAEAVNDGEYLIPRLLRDQKHDAIAKPIGVGGAAISPLLVQKLLNDIGDDPDQLPVLQHALMRMWDVWAASGERSRPIDFKDLEATGGLTAALSRHADEVFEALPDDAHRAACEKVFKTLTEKGADNRGIRRPTRLERLVAIAGADRATVVRVLDAYRQPGVTFLMPGSDVELTDQTVIDLSHESLMRGWQRLRDWVEEEAQSARIFRRLAETASLWRENKAGLFRDPDLQIALSWREEERPNATWAEQYGGDFHGTIDFLEKSRDTAHAEEQEREEARKRELEQARQLAETRARAARAFRRFAVGMGVVALAALGAFLFALQKQRDAEAQKSYAEEQRILAVERENEAEELKARAEEREEQVRLEFARSDIGLGNSFARQGDAGTGLAYLSRALERQIEDDAPAIVDRIFNLLAYTDLAQFRAPAAAGIDRSLNAVAATPDASLVAVGGRNGFFRMTQAGAPVSVDHLPLPAEAWVPRLGLAFTPDGTRLFRGQAVEGGVMPAVLLGRTSDGWSKVADLPIPDLWSISISQDGRRCLAASYYDASVVILDARTGAVLDRIRTLRVRTAPQWTPDETRILVFGADAQHLQLLDLGGAPPPPPEGTRPEEIPAREVPVLAEFTIADPINNVASGIFSPDGSHFLTRAYDGIIQVWDVEDATEPAVTLLGHTPVRQGERDRRSTAAFSPDGTRIVSAAEGSDRSGEPARVLLWSSKAGRSPDRTQRESDSVTLSLAPAQFPAHEAPPVFSADGMRLLIPLWDGRCQYGSFDPGAPDKLPDFGEPRPIEEGYAFLANPGFIKPLLIPQDQVLAAAVDRERAVLAVGVATGRIALFDLLTGEQQGPAFEVAGEVVELAFHPDDASKLAARTVAPERAHVCEIGGTGEPTVSIDLSPLAPVDPRLRRLGFLLGEGSEGILAVSADGRRCSVWPWGTIIGIEGDAAAEAGVSLTERVRVSAAAFSSDGQFLATASEEDEGIRVWDAATGEAVTPPFGGTEQATCLAFNPDGALLATGSPSGVVHLWRIPSAASADRLVIRGDHPCARVFFSPSGHLLATVFESGEGSYAQLWDPATGQAVTGRLATGGRLSDGAFLDDGERLAVWPHRGVGSQATPGLAAVWDVSVSGGAGAPDWLPEVATSFGGVRINADSLPEPIPERIMPPVSESASRMEKRLALLFEWLTAFPSTRPDSPFRPEASDAYVAALVDQADVTLLDEAVRLRPRDPLALARRGAVRLAGQRSDAARTLSGSDVIRARLLAPDDAEVACYHGMVLEAKGHQDEAAAAYARARTLEPMTLAAIRRVVELQSRYPDGTLGEATRRETLDLAIAAAERQSPPASSLAADFRIRRFLLSIMSEDLATAKNDWDVLRELDEFPESHDPADLLDALLELAESEIRRTAEASGDWETAVRDLKPIALAAELAKSFREQDPEADNHWAPSVALGRLVEWQNRQNPPLTLVPRNAVWKYLDDGSDLGTAWRSPDFDDSSWNEGEAKLGYGEDGEVTTIGFGDDPAAKHITTYFRHAFDFVEADRKPYFLIDVVRDDGVIVYLNGVEIARDAMPPDEVSYDTLASELAEQDPADDPPERREYRFSLDGESLKPGRNVVAAEVHQNALDSSDLGFQLHLFGVDHKLGPSLRALLEDEVDGTAVRTLAADLIPKPLRVRWQAALETARSVGGPAVASTNGDRSSEEVQAAVHRLQGMMEDWEGALATADRELAAIGLPQSGEDVARALPWKRMKSLALTKLGRLAEAEAAERELLAPQRNPGLSPRLLDLSPYFNKPLDDPDWHVGASDDLSDLPDTYQPHAGVGYDLRGAVLMGNEYTDIDIEALPVDQKADAIHFLASAVWQYESEDGTALAQVRVHYADGTPDETFPIVLGEDVVDWNAGDPQEDATSPRSRVAWRGPKPNDLRVLNEIVWKNPHPDAAIASLDVISEDAEAALLILGITLQ